MFAGTGDRARAARWRGFGSSALALAASLALAACGSPAEPRDGLAAPGGGREPIEPDLARGEVLSLACQACHTLRAGEAHGIGPNLHGVIGRRAGTLPDFEYSQALAASGIVWTPEAIDAWLADPAGFLPGNNMPFAGYRSPGDRRDLVAYIVGATAP